MKVQNNIDARCIICNCVNTHFFYFELNLTLQQCDDCNSVFVHPLPTIKEYVKNLEINYAVLANKYSGRIKSTVSDRHFNCVRKKEFKWNIKKTFIYKRDLKFIKKYLWNKKQNCMNFLDIGCGEGYFMKEAIKSGFRCEGLEPSKTHIPKKEFGMKIFNVFLKDFKSKRKYDVITLLDVLEHTRDPPNELKMIRKIIKTDGLLMIRVPNLRWLILKEKILNLFYKLTNKNILDFNPQGVYAPHTHLYNFSEKGMKILLENCGFKIVGIEIIKASYSENILKALFYDIYYLIIQELFRMTKMNLAISLNIFAKPIK